MKHFLITRFNLKNINWKKDGEDFSVLTEEWLNHRFSLFETYCLPSVINQTNKNFTWLVAFDQDTPKIYKKRIQSIAMDSANFYPIFIDGYDNFLPSLKSHIIQLCTKNDQHIVTTRLDNDDIIHKDFIETVQNLFVPTSNTVIDLRLGYQLAINNGTFEARLLHLAYNHFISLIESTSNFETVFSREHSQWKNFATALLKTKQRLWIQLVHGKNKSNKKDYTLRRISTLDIQDFGIDLQNLNDSWTYVAVYNLILFPYRAMMSAKNSITEYLTE